jgi:hypothetical protein
MASNASRDEQLDANAIRSLLQTIASDLDPNSDRLSPEALHRLTERLDSILGDAPQSQPQFNQDGLPIQEITEHVDDSVAAEENFTPEPLNLPSLSSLTPEERSLKRRQQDRILDLLEAEEELAKRQEEKEAYEKKREAYEKYAKLKAEQEEDKKKDKQLAKKMGKALVSWRRDDNDNDNDQQETSPQSNNSEQPPESTPKKSVKFADDVDSQSEPNLPADWGDVSAGRLRPGTVHSNPFTPQTMVERVVERFPSADASTSTSSRPVTLAQDDADSDDESDPEADIDDEPEPPESELSEDDDMDVDADMDLAGEIDLDEAQHRREIALEYHRKRALIGDTATKAMLRPSNESSEDPSVCILPLLTSCPFFNVATRLDDPFKEISHIPLPRLPSRLRIQRLHPNSLQPIPRLLRPSRIPYQTNSEIHPNGQTGR